ncbi:hypothetical protein DFH08DRAFT_988982 [Mycena albidolilacea]|uniref:Sphingomyelin phosphodiesterase n=1 Tax=Mycena albidolilacea TaxID=1033008 RepID=A0AAD6Z0L5_9AGAR|nr:hypothetical protein DFH08DRAFT_988982 [Mycena albidolilacea]
MPAVRRNRRLQNIVRTSLSNPVAVAAIPDPYPSDGPGLNYIVTRDLVADVAAYELGLQTAEKLFDALLGMCVTHPINEFTVPFPKPLPKHPKAFKSRGRPTVGAEANCTRSICCRDFDDSPAAESEVLECHWGWEVTTDLKAFDVQMAAKLTALIFPSLGNHDSAPVNAFARTTSNTANNSQLVFDTQSAGWDHWIGAPAAFEVDHHSGAYSAKVPGMDLRIIAVNTQYWYKQNYWLYDSDVLQPDPNGIIALVVDALQAAEDAGDRAWIIGHIPLGKEDTLIDQSNYYDQVLQCYKNTIAGRFFGHSHKDPFEVAYSNYSEQTAANAVGVGLIGPALTPTTNISEPSFQVRSQWGLYYSARETYGPLVGLSPNEPLSPAFRQNLTEVFAANKTAFQMFNTFISRGGAVTACDAPSGCQNTTICDMRAFRSQDNCVS